MESKSLFVNCPQCGKEHVWDSANRYRPFCGQRCKMIDLGKWANEEYCVPQTAMPLEENDYQS